MNDAVILQIGLEAMMAAAKIAAPVLITSLAVGLFVGMLQSVTQIQETTLTFVPKMAAAGLVMLLAGSWMLNELVTFTQTMLAMVPELISS